MTNTRVGRWIAAGVFGLGLLGYAAFAVDRSADRVEDQLTIEQAGQQLTAVADPLKRLCDTDPSVRARVGEACDAATQAVSTRLVRGADGADGEPGVPGTPGIDGGRGTPGVDGVPGAPGMDGEPGADGMDGMSPACLAEPSQCRGQDGEDGRDGQDGADGRDGVDGQPGRDGSPAAELVLNNPDGTTTRCPRTGGPDTAPVYTCQPA